MTTATEIREIESVYRRVLRDRPEMTDFADAYWIRTKALWETEQAASDWVTAEGRPINGNASTRLPALVLRALDKGYEPTSVPAHWYCGTLPRPEREDIWLGGWMFGTVREHEQWPDARMKEKDYLPTPGFFRSKPAKKDRLVQKFKAPLPKGAYEAYREAEKLFTGVRIYSPDPMHFEEHPLRSIDPVIIGQLNDGKEALYFEVFRWDIKEDIAYAINATRK